MTERKRSGNMKDKLERAEEKNGFKKGVSTVDVSLCFEVKKSRKSGRTRS
jgi:hypothetical protein